MNNSKYYIEVINNKIWAYKIIFQQEPNTVIIPSKIYEVIKLELNNLNKNIIVCDDFKEIRCINMIKGLSSI
jgi:hypothetical protein